MFVNYSSSAQPLNNNYDTSSSVLCIFILQSTFHKPVDPLPYSAITCYISFISLPSSTKNIRYPCVPLLAIHLPFSIPLPPVLCLHLFLCLFASCAPCLECPCPPSHLPILYSAFNAQNKCYQFCETTPDSTFILILQMLITTNISKPCWMVSLTQWT